MSAGADRLARRVAELSGVRRIGAAEERVAALEVAVAENATLEVPLAALVARLEAATLAVADGSAES